MKKSIKQEALRHFGPRRMCDSETLYDAHGLNIKGDSNTIYGSGCVLCGDSNTLYGDDNIVVGDFNTVHGNRCRVAGDCNTVHGNDGKVAGDCNNAHGQRNQTEGDCNNGEGGSAGSQFTQIIGNGVNIQSFAGGGTVRIGNGVVQFGPSVQRVNARSGANIVVNGKRIDTSNGGIFVNGRRIDGNDGAPSNVPSGASDQLVFNNNKLPAQLVKPQPTEDHAALEGEKECVICLENAALYALVPCGHRLLCNACSRALPSEECPECRQQIQAFLRVYQ